MKTASFFIYMGKAFDEAYKTHILIESLLHLGLPKSDVFLFAEEPPSEEVRSLFDAVGYSIQPISALPEMLIARKGQAQVILGSNHLALAPLSFAASETIHVAGETLQSIIKRAGIEGQYFSPAMHGLFAYEQLDRFGYIDAGSGEEKRKADQANRFIASLKEKGFFLHYKMGLAKERIARPEVPSAPFAVIQEWARGTSIRKIIFHVGTPKTGTTALQEYLFTHRDELLTKHRIWYPDPSPPPQEPQHHVLSDIFSSWDFAKVAQDFLSILQRTPKECEIVIFSTERLYDFWQMVEAFPKQTFRHLSAIIPVEFWVWFRPPQDFAESYYQQVLRGRRPVLHGFNPIAKLEDNLDGEWIRPLMDYLGFALEAKEILGDGNVRLFPYGNNTISACLTALGAESAGTDRLRHNESLRAPGIDIMRLVNRYDYLAPRKAEILAIARQIDQLLGDKAPPYQTSPEAMKKIQLLTEKSWRLLFEKTYGAS